MSGTYRYREDDAAPGEPLLVGVCEGSVAVKKGVEVVTGVVGGMSVWEVGGVDDGGGFVVDIVADGSRFDLSLSLSLCRRCHVVEMCCVDVLLNEVVVETV